MLVESISHEATRKKFVLEFRTEAADRVIDSRRAVEEVAKELSITEHLLCKWVRNEHRRTEAESKTGNEPLSPAERQELLGLGRELQELQKDNAF